MAKRRKRSPKSISEEDEDYEPEKVDKKQRSRTRKRSSRYGKDREVNKTREAALIFGVAGILIAAALGWYVWDADLLGLQEDDDNGGETPEVQYGIKLEVISDQSHKFDTSSYHRAHPHENTQFLLLVTNKGTGIDTFNIQLSNAPAGWGYQLGSNENKLDSSNNIRIIAGGAEVLILTVNAPESGSVSTQVTAYSMKDTTQKSMIEVRTQVQELSEETAKVRDKVKVYYTLVDRGTDDAYNKNKWAWNQANEFPFTIGEGVIEGFSYMAEGMREGETRVEILPADICYGVNSEDGKPDGPLAYEMTMLDLDTES